MGGALVPVAARLAEAFDSKDHALAYGEQAQRSKDNGQRRKKCRE